MKMNDPRRVQRARTPGWRMPDGAVYVGRPSIYGNPFAWSGERATWMALAFGERADEAGRRAAAVKLYRWWIRGAIPAEIPVPTESDISSGAIEYTSGAVRQVADIASGLGLFLFLREPLLLPPRPDLEPLRGKVLVCWCELGLPCHIDAILEELDRTAVPA